MTEQERRDLIEHLMNTRPAGNKPFVAPEFYKKFFDDTKVEEREIQTSAGDTKIWLVDKIGRTEKTAVFVNIHGGGFIAPHLDRDVIFSQRLASELGILVVDISYRTAGEAEFPVACYESYDCVKWVHEHAEELNVDKNKIIVGGHSAGANLTVGISLQAKEKQEFKVAMQILDYPPLDLYTDPAEKPESDKTMIPVQRARDFNSLYVGSQEKARNVLASPVFADLDMLSGLAETVIFTAGYDNLRFEAEEFAGKLIQAGVQVTVRRFLNSGHGFVIGCVGEYNEAIQSMEIMIRTVMKRTNEDNYQTDDYISDQTFTGQE